MTKAFGVQTRLVFLIGVIALPVIAWASASPQSQDEQVCQEDCQVELRQCLEECGRHSNPIECESDCRRDGDDCKEDCRR